MIASTHRMPGPRSLRTCGVLVVMQQGGAEPGTMRQILAKRERPCLGSSREANVRG